jgi:hypothetical protein
MLAPQLLRYNNETTRESSTSTNGDTISNTETMNVTKKIPHPQSMDVILGRGTAYAKHPGNMIFKGKEELVTE